MTAFVVDGRIEAVTSINVKNCLYMQKRKVPVKTNEDKLKKYKCKTYWKITYNDEATIIELASLDYTKTFIAQTMGVSVKTVYNYLNKNPRLLTRIESAKKFPNILSRQTVINQIGDGDARLWLDYLKLTDEKFKPKQEIQTNVTVVNILADIRWVNKGWLENSLPNAQRVEPMVENTLD